MYSPTSRVAASEHEQGQMKHGLHHVPEGICCLKTPASTCDGDSSHTEEDCTAGAPGLPAVKEPESWGGPAGFTREGLLSPVRHMTLTRSSCDSAFTSEPSLHRCGASLSGPSPLCPPDGDQDPVPLLQAAGGSSWGESTTEGKGEETAHLPFSFS